MDSFKLKNRKFKYEFPVGYVQDNVVPCCYICNRMKGVLSKEEFMEHLDKVFTRVA